MIGKIGEKAEAKAKAEGRRGGGAEGRRGRRADRKHGEI
jgi:hypothetical protein